jgi:glucose-1-phosphate adenylyltransferase
MNQGPSATPVFVLAGGAGERLIPLTEAKPKPAVSFGGTHQIIDFTLSNCVNSGLRKIFVLTQYQREHLHDYIRESRVRLSQSFRWHEGDQLLSVPPVSGRRYRGTADAVFQNLPLIQFDSAEHVLIASGDHIYSMDYRPLLWRHAMSGADMTIAAVRRPVNEATAFGVLDVEDDAVVGFNEKPSRSSLPDTGDVLVSMGVYVFRRKALLDIADRATPLETDFGRDIVPMLIRARKVAAYDFGSSPRNYWRDVGSLDSYFQANMDLLGSRPKFDMEIDSHWPMYAAGDSSTVKTSSSRVSRRALIGSWRIEHSVVSHGACIGRGALVENSVILPGAQVGKSVQLRNTIVAEGVSIPDGSKVGMNMTEDRTRFMVTAGGVVVVNAAPCRPSIAKTDAVGFRRVAGTAFRQAV